MDPIASNYPMWLVFLLPIITKDGYTYKNIKNKHYPIITFDTVNLDLQYSITSNKRFEWENDIALFISLDTKTSIRKMSFSFPKLLEYLDLLYQSKYSDIPTTFKTRILTFWKASPNTLLFRVLNGPYTTIWSKTEGTYGKYDFNTP